MRGNTIDAMGRVDILHCHYLIAGGTALARGNDGPGKEELPYLLIVSNSVAVVTHPKLTYTKPFLTIFSFDEIAVSYPVPIPSPEGSRVMNSYGVDASNYQPSLASSTSVN